MPGGMDSTHEESARPQLRAAGEVARLSHLFVSSAVFAHDVQTRARDGETCAHVAVLVPLSCVRRVYVRTRARRRDGTISRTITHSDSFPVIREVVVSSGAVPSPAETQNHLTHLHGCLRTRTLRLRSRDRKS